MQQFAKYKHFHSCSNKFAHIADKHKHVEFQLHKYTTARSSQKKISWANYVQHFQLVQAS